MTITDKGSLYAGRLSLRCLTVVALLLIWSATTIGAEESSLTQALDEGAAAPSAGLPGPALWLLMDAEGSYRAGSYGEEFADRGAAVAVSGSVNVASGGFSAVADLLAANDGKYGAALADIPGGNLYGFYFLMREGGLRYRTGPLSVEIGRFRTYDEVDSPYSLFVNSAGISSTTMAVAYDDGFFFYKSRWIGLNHDSASGLTANYSGYTDGSATSSFPERGANIKVTGLRLGEMRVGLQDAAVYAGRWFDYEYFLSPMPMYFTQYCRGTGGVPWDTAYDDNDNVGLFWDWVRPGDFSALAQVFIDDCGAGEILSGWPKNPWQIAASLGGRKETSLGSFGLYAAMATKYTFEPSNASTSTDAYGYSYYPETHFTSYWQDGGTTTSAISIEDNEIGYKYGENNLAVQADWRGSAFGLELGTALEFRLAGSNSPANPGHNDAKIESNGTRWLDDAVLEKRFTLSVGVAKRIGAWRLYGTMDAGIAFDALELAAATDTTSNTANSIWIYEPVAGNTKGLFSLSLGATYRLDIKPMR